MKHCLWSPFYKTLLFFWSTKAPFCVSIKKKMWRFYLQHGLLRNKAHCQVSPMNWNTHLTTCFVTRADKVHQSKLHLWQLFRDFAAKNSYKYLLLGTILAIWEHCSSLRVWNPFRPASLLHEKCYKTVRIIHLKTSFQSAVQNDFHVSTSLIG